MPSEETLNQNNESLNQVLQVLGDFRREVNQSIGELRTEMNQSIGELRMEMNQSIGDLRKEMNQSIGDLRREMNERFSIIEADIDQIKQSQFSFDVRLDRNQAMAHDALNIGHDLKADVKILTAEVRAWAADVAGLQQRA